VKQIKELVFSNQRVNKISKKMPYSSGISFGCSNELQVWAQMSQSDMQDQLIFRKKKDVKVSYNCHKCRAF
jgi:hypothetical protein